MKRKAGRKKRGEPSADELNSDAMLAKEMGISTSKLNRTSVFPKRLNPFVTRWTIIRWNYPLRRALSFLKPENQTAVIDLIGLNFKPTVKRVQRLRDAEKIGKLDDKTMRDILEVKTSSRSSRLNRRNQNHRSQSRRRQRRRFRLHQW